MLRPKSQILFSSLMAILFPLLASAQPTQRLYYQMSDKKTPLKGIHALFNKTDSCLYFLAATFLSQIETQQPSCIYKAKQLTDSTFSKPIKVYDLYPSAEVKPTNYSWLGYRSLYNFPSFSADGKTLYFVQESAKSADEIKYLDLQNPESGPQLLTALSSPDEEAHISNSTCGNFLYATRRSKEGAVRLLRYTFANQTVQEWSLPDEFRDFGSKLIWFKSTSNMLYLLGGQFFGKITLAEKQLSYAQVCQVKSLPYGDSEASYFGKKLYWNSKGSSEKRNYDAFYTPLKRCVLQEIGDYEQEVLVFEDVLFESNSAQLGPAAEAKLNELLQRLLKNKLQSAHIIAHTDDLGEDTSNQALSEKRAEAVRNYLITKGIAAKRLTSEGKGEKEPLLPNTNPDNRTKNRRVEVLLSR